MSVVGNVDYPVFSVSSAGPLLSFGEVTVPSFSAEGTTETYNKAQGVIVFPEFDVQVGIGVTANGELTFATSVVSARTGEHIAVTFSDFSVASTALTDYKGNVTTEVPTFSVAGTAFTGALGKGSCKFPLSTVSSTAYFIPVGTGDTDFPTFYIGSTAHHSDTFATTVLRYSRP